MTPDLDPFNPCLWDNKHPQFWALWLDPQNDIYCVVDYVDYTWAQQWTWHPTPNSTGRKHYATRMTTSPKTKRQVKIYLHKEIMKRKGERKRTKLHKIADHRDGDSLNNRRSNLRWATGSMNNRNARRSV